MYGGDLFEIADVLSLLSERMMLCQLKNFSSTATISYECWSGPCLNSGLIHLNKGMLVVLANGY